MDKLEALRLAAQKLDEARSANFITGERKTDLIKAEREYATALEALHTKS